MAGSVRRIVGLGAGLLLWLAWIFQSLPSCCHNCVRAIMYSLDSLLDWTVRKTRVIRTSWPGFGIWRSRILGSIAVRPTAFRLDQKIGSSLGSLVSPWGRRAMELGEYRDWRVWRSPLRTADFHWFRGSKDFVVEADFVFAAGAWLAGVCAGVSVVAKNKDMN